MATADDLMTSAQRFYALARVASNTTTKLQLVSLADDYFRQANEFKADIVAALCSGSSKPEAIGR